MRKESVLNLNKFIVYTNHQYRHGKVALLAGIPYECFKDTINLRIFCVNQNNEIIYLDRIGLVDETDRIK